VDDGLELGFNYGKGLRVSEGFEVGEEAGKESLE